MLNHPVTGLTNASKWRHEDLLAEAEHVRLAAQCPGPIQRAFWRAWLGSLRMEPPPRSSWPSGSRGTSRARE